jgi:Zn-dependent M16 (insulinase) family peptidase
LKSALYIHHFRACANWNTIPRFYIKAPCVVIRGKPSAKLAEKLEKDENLRVAAQVKRLGPKGLKDAEKALQDAKSEHERPIPTDILTSFPVPDVKSISWLPVQSLQEQGRGRDNTGRVNLKSDLAKHIRSDGSDLPFFVQYDHVQVRHSIFFNEPPFDKC